MIWEYNVLRIETDSYEYEINDILNEQGLKGWELIKIHDKMLYFKRIKENNNEH